MRYKPEGKGLKVYAVVFFIERPLSVTSLRMRFCLHIDIFKNDRGCRYFISGRFFCGTIWSSGRSLDFRILSGDVNILFTFDFFKSDRGCRCL